MSTAGDVGGQGGYDPARQPACVRHPERTTGLSCARCGRPSCSECLREAPVGFQCVDCVREGTRSVRRGRTLAGGAGVDKPVVVPTLIAVNTAIFLLTVVQAGSMRDNSSAALFRAWSLLVPAVLAGDWWRLLTSGFLHFGPIHLVFNMLALYVIGRDLETVLGRGRLLAVYLIALLGGSVVAFFWSDPRAETAGASGAVFGLMGGLAVVLHRLRVSPRPALTLIGINLVISVLVPNVSLAGHLGGLVAGGTATAALVLAPTRNRGRWQVALCVAEVLVLVLVLLLAVSARGAGLLDGGSW